MCCAVVCCAVLWYVVTADVGEVAYVAGLGTGIALMFGVRYAQRLLTLRPVCVCL